MELWPRVWCFVLFLTHCVVHDQREYIMIISVFDRAQSFSNIEVKIQ